MTDSRRERSKRDHGCRERRAEHERDAGLSRLLEERLDLRAILAEKRIPLEELLALTVGSVIVFGEIPGGEVRLEAGGAPIATGTAVRKRREGGGERGPTGTSAPRQPARLGLRVDRARHRREVLVDLAASLLDRHELLNGSPE
ncbi:MAG: FliM/FliN family flagellar motor C-terminal domain-containing protein [Planctomycetota bacterium]